MTVFSVSLKIHDSVHKLITTLHYNPEKQPYTIILKNNPERKLKNDPYAPENSTNPRSL